MGPGNKEPPTAGLRVFFFVPLQLQGYRLSGPHDTMVLLAYPSELGKRDADECSRCSRLQNLSTNNITA